MGNVAEEFVAPLAAGWGTGFSVIRRLDQGSTASATLLERAGRYFVAKTASLTDASAAWEAELLEFLERERLQVPQLVPTLSGGFTSDGLILMTYMDGRPPTSSDDWQSVAAYLNRLHLLTHDWPARPDMPSVVSLLRTTDVLREDMDAGVQSLLRQAWSGISGSPTSVIHGDPNPHNVVLTGAGAALVDWEESCLDFSMLDEAGVPGGESLRDAFPASLAWEAFLFWESQPTYARRCLSRLDAMLT